MKIHGPDHSRINNPYQKQLQKQNQIHKNADQKDHIEISKQAKQMQNRQTGGSERDAHIQKIKQAIETGKYQVDPAQTAEKMLGFWDTRM